MDKRAQLRLAICGVVLWLGAPAAEQTGGTVREALRRALPRYDPAVREAAVKESAAAGGASETAVGSAVPAAPPGAEAPAVEPGVVQLEPFVVQAWRQRRPPALPRLRVPSTPSAAAVTGAFASAQERRRVMKKVHLGVVGQVLNPSRFGDLLAGEAEAAALTAERLADAADKIDLALLGGATEREAAELREIYLQMLVKRNR